MIRKSAIVVAFVVAMSTQTLAFPFPYIPSSWPISGVFENSKSLGSATRKADSDVQVNAGKTR